jgi:signal transduction histidine kinase
MQTLTTERLTRTYLQKLDKQNYLATAITVIIVTLSLFWQLFRLGGEGVTVFFAGAMYPIASIIGASWACITAYRARYGPLRLARRHQLAWLLITIGLFTESLGGAYFTYLEHTGRSNPVPSYADIGFTLFYPLTFAGLLLMPKEPATQKPRLRTGLDALITTLCLLGISWFFFISKIFTAPRDAQGASIASIVTSVSYPFWDLLLIFAIILLIWHGTERILHPSLLLCGTGILTLCWADTGYTYFTALNTYVTGTPYIDTFWFFSFFMIGLSALYQYKALVNRAYNEQIHPTQVITRTEAAVLPGSTTASRHLVVLQSTLIYLPLAVLLALMLYGEFTGSTRYTGRTLFLVTLTAFVGMLVVMLYLLTTHENEHLLQEREQARREAEHLRALGTELTNILEPDHLIGRIVQLITSDLGFDAAMLVLLDKYDPPSKVPPCLQIQVEPATSAGLRAWNMQCKQFDSCMPLMEKTMNIHWARQSIMLPPTLEIWRQEHSICTTLSIPIKHKEQLLGCLGFASRSEEPFSQHYTQLAKTYTEQVTAVIAHACLYQHLRSAHQRLQELDQLKDQFMATASHELRTPLTAVQGYIELLLLYEDMLPPKQRKEFLLKAQRSCNELVVLLQNVMDASQLEIEGSMRPSHIEPIRVQAMLDSVIMLIEPHLTKEQREVHRSIPTQLTVYADAERLRQVLLNLSVNALKYSPPSTPIAFSAYTTFDSPHSVIINVTDKGKGIPPHEQARLFERFVRMERDINSSVRGSGLGLYICRRLLETMDGKIWLESSGIPGEGSTFYIQLLLAE